jgi:uncharacterized protein YcfJ
MKKVLLIALGAAVIMSSCSSYNTATGAYAGAQFGHVIGSAIGGITGGWRGHEWGSLIGTVGGIAAGAAVGAAVDNAHQKKMEKRREAAQASRERGVQRQQRQERQRDYSYDDSGYDPEGRGDDRITFGDEPAPSSMRSPLEIRNAGVYEHEKDGVLCRGEECTVVFEIYNTTDRTIYDVCPLVEDVTGNKHVNVSPNLRIESIAPHKGIRYTASILADSRLKDGEIVIRVGVAEGNNEVTSQTREFTVPTSKTVRK